MPEKKLKVILTGATGMVGEGVLLECLEDDRVEEVLVVTRKSTYYSHAKLKEIIHPNFFDLKRVEGQFKGYNACFFCAGVSSVGMKEEKYFQLTYTMTMGFAEVFSRLNPGATFCYVSGAGTDSSEKGRMMWARVKGKTENDLQKLDLDVYNFRPAFMIPREEAKNPPKLYRYIGGLIKLLEKLMPNYVSGLDLVGKAMINISFHPSDKKVLEVRDIRERADND
jgi:nucleoside-diphosphate-sugar epimerase